MLYKEVVDNGGPWFGDLCGHENWLFVIGRNRDSDILEEANWKAALTRLGGESETCVIHRFNHWAVGWVEYMIVAPSRKADVDSIHEDLEQYPVLDDDLFSQMEDEYVGEAWRSFGADDKREYLKKAGLPTKYYRRKYYPGDIDTNGLLLEYLAR